MHPRGLNSSRIPLSVWLFLFGASVRLLTLCRLADSPYFLPDFGDMKFYSEWARQIAQGHLTTGAAFYGLPGYAYLMGLVFAVAGFDPFLIGIMQALVEGGTAVIIYKVVMAVLGSHQRGKIAGIGAAMAWIFYQPAQAFSIILMPTCWLVLAFWGCLYWILCTRSRSSWWPWLGMGLLVGVVSMTIATILFMLPLVILAICFQVEGLGRKGLAIGGMFAAVLMGMSPCWIHNRFIAGEPVLLSAHGGLNFYVGNNETANGYSKTPPGMGASQTDMLQDSIRMAEKEMGRELKRYEVSAYWSQKAHVYIHNHFRDWLKLMALKFKNFWNAYQYDDLSVITHFANDGIILPGLRFGFVASLGLAGMVVGAWRYPRSRWVTGAVLLHMCALMTVFITERYRLAAVPGLCILGAVFVAELWQSLVSGCWKRAGFLAILPIGFALLVAIPQTDPRLWWLDYHNIGVRATNAGELEKAQYYLEIAHNRVPTNPEGNFALGNLWLAKEDRDRAKAFYNATIQYAPTHARAWNNLGVLAFDEKRWDLARQCLENSLAIRPGDAKTYFLLAKIQMAVGNFKAAAEQIQKAMALKADEPQFQQLAGEIQAKLQAGAAQNATPGEEPLPSEAKVH